MTKPNKTKAHHSFLWNDASGMNVPNIQKTGKGRNEILQFCIQRFLSTYTFRNPWLLFCNFVNSAGNACCFSYKWHLHELRHIQCFFWKSMKIFFQILAGHAHFTANVSNKGDSARQHILIFYISDSRTLCQYKVLARPHFLSFYICFALKSWSK